MQLTETKTSLKTSFNTEDVKEIAAFCQTKLTSHLNPLYAAYDWDYTLDMIENADYLLKKEKLDNKDQNFVKSILYFSNLGYATEKDEPLKMSGEIAEDYLLRRGFTDAFIKEFVHGIVSLEDDGKTLTPRIAIAQDVRAANYGDKKLKKKLSRRYEEYKMANEESTDEVKWMDSMIDKIVKHKFNSRNARKKWRKAKKKNIKDLQRHVFKLKKGASLSYNKKAMTMFKTASRNQIDLVNIADKKAGIMITVNAILITIMLPLFASYIIDMSKYILPALILMITCGTSIILATLATKPANHKAPSTQEFQNGDRSLFFFRNFVTLNKEDYKTAVLNLIVRDSSFENAVITDLYDLGTTLDIKYRKLTWCYWVFAIGIGLTIISFFGCLLFFGSM